MTRNEARAMAALMLAYADGKTIQYMEPGNSMWTNVDRPTFNFGRVAYRIKPEPKDMWVNEYSDFFGNVWESREEAIKAHSIDAIRVAVHYREVCDE